MYRCCQRCCKVQFQGSQRCGQCHLGSCGDCRGSGLWRYFRHRCSLCCCPGNSDGNSQGLRQCDGRGLCPRYGSLTCKPVILAIFLPTYRLNLDMPVLLAQCDRMLARVQGLARPVRMPQHRPVPSPLPSPRLWPAHLRPPPTSALRQWRQRKPAPLIPRSPPRLPQPVLPPAPQVCVGTAEMVEPIE